MTRRNRFLSKAISIISATAIAIAAVPAISPEVANVATVEAAASGIITGGEGTQTTTLTTNESATVTVKDCVLTMKVGTSSETFKIANSSKVVGMAKIEADDLLHIFTLSGKYYVVDLQYGMFTTIAVYRNQSTGSYVKEKSAGSYEVFAKAFIPNSSRFYEVVSQGVTSPMDLVKRADFTSIVNPTPSPSPSPSPDPTPNPSQDTSTEESTSTTETHTETKFDISWWYTQYITGKITWNQLMEALTKFSWTVKTDTTSSSESVTYYFYDETGKLQYTRTITTGNSSSNSNGNGQSQTTSQTTGNADAKVENNTSGSASASASSSSSSTTKTTTKKSTKKSTKKTTKKGKITYNSYKTSKKVVLTMTQNGKCSTVVSVKFDSKKGIMRWNDKTYKGVKDVAFTSGSNQILMLKKNGQAWIIPRAKGNKDTYYIDKKLKGKWTSIKRASTQLAIRLANGSGKVLGVKNEQPKTKKVK